mmetsp:Transcript_4118/g.9348  ORF Transcript_4118/g.9348 Transcript_4118/m.9348 type:complete len:203 (+) Transcript_4118:664-1272(+)
MCSGTSLLPHREHSYRLVIAPRNKLRTRWTPRHARHCSHVTLVHPRRSMQLPHIERKRIVIFVTHSEHVGFHRFHSRQLHFLDMIVFCNAKAVRVPCKPIPRSFEQCAIRSRSAGLYRTVVTVSSLPQRLLNVDMGVERSGSQRCTAASEEAVRIANRISDERWSGKHWNCVDCFWLIGGDRRCFFIVGFLFPLSDVFGFFP